MSLLSRRAKKNVCGDTPKQNPSCLNFVMNMSNFVKGVTYPQKVYSYWQKEQNLELILVLKHANKWLLASTLICLKKKKWSLYHSIFSSAPSTRYSARKKNLPFTVSSGDKCKRDHIDWGKALPTIWSSSMNSTWEGALCWQRTKQGTKWTPGQIKIHQDIWIGCPASKLLVGIKSKVKWNVTLLHISVIITALECIWYTPKWKKLLHCPL